MAKKVQVLLVDDIDKSSPADETVSFSLDGVSYEIDLTSQNAAKLRDDLSVWIGHAEPSLKRLLRQPGKIPLQLFLWTGRIHTSVPPP